MTRYMLENSQTYRSWIPHGFDYLPPDEAHKLLKLKEKVRDELQKAGYAEIIPPTFDYEQTFRLTTRDSIQENLFQTRDVDGHHLAVRSDLTVQVIKAAANGRFGDDFPMRLSYIGPVFQDHLRGSGHNRELIQAGVELIGPNSQARFIELLELARDVLGSIGYRPRILYGDVEFLNILFENIPERFRSSLSEAFYNKDRSRIRFICESAEISEEETRLLTEVPLIFGGKEALDKLAALCKNRQELLDILERSQEIVDVVYDFSLVRDLSYYTGPVFEAYIEGSKERILSGGVYDSLFRQFTDRQKCACGFAIDLTAMMQLYQP